MSYVREQAKYSNEVTIMETVGLSVLILVCYFFLIHAICEVEKKVDEINNQRRK